MRQEGVRLQYFDSKWGIEQMFIIKLNEQNVASRQDHLAYGGWSDVYVFEPLWINVEQIESMVEKGITIIHMKSGNTHRVKESVEDIMSLMHLN